MHAEIKTKLTFIRNKWDQSRNENNTINQVKPNKKFAVLMFFKIF